jgi:hypothetical protein
MKKIILGVLLVLALPVLASAHQPRLVKGTETIVTEPEISKAYYGELAGDPNTFIIQSDKDFALYVNILAPDIKDQKKDLSVSITKIDNGLSKPIILLDGLNFTWTRFWEPFGRDWYWKGPEYKAQVGAGKYVLRVWSADNNSRYSLAIGEKESFPLGETIRVMGLVPNLKSSFFNESPAGFILSPFGFGYVVVIFILAFVFGLIYHLIQRRISRGKHRLIHNIGKRDRWVRVLLAIFLLLWAICTTWNPIIIFLSGFVLFEAIFSWCGLYAAMGRNTCPIE